MSETAGAVKEDRSKISGVIYNFGWLASIATVIGTLFSAYVYFSEKKSKEIKLSLLESSAFLQSQRGVDQNIAITIGERRVDDAWYHRFRYDNTGRLPVKKEEIEDVTRVWFGDLEILSVSISSRSPRNLQSEVKIKDNTIQIVHGLMNPQDFIEFDIIATRPIGSDLSCSFRISEIKECLFENKASRRNANFLTLFQINPYLTATIVVSLMLMTLAAASGMAAIVGSAVWRWAKYLHLRQATSIEGILAKIGINDSARELFEWKSLRNPDQSEYRRRAISAETLSEQAPNACGNSVDEPNIGTEGSGRTFGEILVEGRRRPVSREEYQLALELLDAFLIHKGIFAGVRFSRFDRDSSYTIDLEKKIVTVIAKSKSKFEKEDILFGGPVLLLCLANLFILGGPFRTLYYQFFP